jgi:hypothetical protein
LDQFPSRRVRDCVLFQASEVVRYSVVRCSLAAPPVSLISRRSRVQGGEGVSSGHANRDTNCCLKKITARSLMGSHAEPQKNPGVWRCQTPGGLNPSLRGFSGERKVL